MDNSAVVAADLVDRLGVLGVGLGAFLNGVGAPGIAEVLLPLGAVAVQKGRMSLVSLVVVAISAEMLGVGFAYFIARSGGLKIVERYGKYIFITKRELRASERAFEKFGGWLVLFGSFIPGIQGLVGYVAGVAKMNFGRFMVAAFFGKLVWIGGLIYLGWILGGHIDIFLHSIKQISVVVLSGTLGLVILHFWRRRYHQPPQGSKD
jgi:membrane protein DedA with SNARE-associated domain